MYHNGPSEVFLVPRSLPPIADFQRDFDELFDELLIGRWRVPATESEPAMVLERKNAYEVRLCTGAFKPSELEVVVSEKQLTVRAKHGDHAWERLVRFTDPVQTEKVTAKFANRILTVVLPKKSKRPRTERK
jgi:HSP20 family molecular chaperone IbpA